jgi:catechol 2,3-dioxygenase-like lactoylglutathione lyase family enzyme
VVTRLDHLVILVRDLEEAVEDYGGLGFRVTPGGEHADGLTRNALVPFRDGAYLELVSFIDPEDMGLVDYCAASDGLREDVERLRGLGFEVDGPHDGGRRLPGGEEIRWRSASIGQNERVLPFLIEDVTPREKRVPGGRAADHPNGATGIPRLELSAPDTRKASANLAALTGSQPGPLRLGACELVPAEQGTEQRAGPTVVTLSTDKSENAGELDWRSALGVRFTLSAEAEG